MLSLYILSAELPTNLQNYGYKYDLCEQFEHYV